MMINKTLDADPHKADEILSDEWDASWVALKLYTAVLAQEKYGFFTVDDMASLSYFLTEYQQLDQETRELEIDGDASDKIALASRWAGLTEKIEENLAILRDGALGL